MEERQPTIFSQRMISQSNHKAKQKSVKSELIVAVFWSFSLKQFSIKVDCTRSHSNCLQLELIEIGT
jgi:hypothetical protein